MDKTSPGIQPDNNYECGGLSERTPGWVRSGVHCSIWIAQWPHRPASCCNAGTQIQCGQIRGLTIPEEAETLVFV